MANTSQYTVSSSQNLDAHRKRGWCTIDRFLFLCQRAHYRPENGKNEQMKQLHLSKRAQQANRISHFRPVTELCADKRCHAVKVFGESISGQRDLNGKSKNKTTTGET